MRPGRFFWKLFLGNAVLMVIALITCTFLIIREFDRLRREETALYLRTCAASLAAVVVEHPMDIAHPAKLQSLAAQTLTGNSLEMRITFLAPDGRVWADSDAPAEEMESHADRPEFIQAIAQGFGESLRWSHTVSREMHYAAVRIGDAAQPLGVIRVAIPASSIGLRGESATRLAITIALIGLSAMILLALGIARLWSRRISAITQAALHLLRGNFSTRIDVSGSDEVAMLARALNHMREHLSGQLRTIERQNTSLKSMLAQLREGIIVVARDGRIRLINPQAIRLLELVSPRRDGAFEGLSFEQCIPHHDVQELLRCMPEVPAETPPSTAETGASSHSFRVPSATAPAGEVEIQIDGRDGEISLLARVFSVPLPDIDIHEEDAPSNRTAGRLLIFTDITQLTQIIQMKSDFAANASHELRTPLAAIRAAVETLRTLEGIADRHPATHFLGMIERQMGRMEAMVLDLLDLSRVETPGARFQPDTVRLRLLLNEAGENFGKDLSEKQLRWEVEVAPDCERLFVSSQLLRISLRNLIENSIRFTATGGYVRITARREGELVLLEVSDNGCGIPPEDQSRVFERFYQVERARSGHKRGTGLGLSIVRHAVAAMHGTVHLTSELGKGTTVRIELPDLSDGYPRLT